jgi:excisionase family DNA binding protein
MDEMAKIQGVETLWSVMDVARYLRTSRSWTYKAVERGVLPVVRIGRLVRFRPEDIRAFVAGDVGGGPHP